MLSTARERPTHVLRCIVMLAALVADELPRAEHASAACAEDGDVEALLASMMANEQAANAEERTPEQEAAMMEATREEAAAHGVNEKSHGEHGWVNGAAL